VAQVALNALKADVVNTDKEGDIIVEGVVTIPGKITYNKVEDDSVNYNGADPGTNDAKYQQLCEKLYEDKLTFTAAGEPDNFGRSASAWKFDGEEIIKVADKANRSYIGGVKTGTIYSNLGLSTKIEATNEIKVYEDGADVTASYSSSTANDIQKDGDTKYGTDGQTVEVFYNKDAADDTTKVTICIINTYLGIVTDDDVVEDDKDGVEITLYGSGAADTYFYETSLYQKGDVLLVNVGRNADDEYVIEAILGEPETVSGSVTRIGKDDDLTISGKKYPQAAQFSGADNDVIEGIDTINTTNVAISSDATYTLYLDQNGNYLAAVEDENANVTTDLVYVFSVTGGTVISGNKAEYSMFATVVRMDGTVETVPVGPKSNDPESINSTAVTAAQTTYMKGKLVDLTYDEDEDEYTIDEAADYTSTDLNCTAELKADSKYAKLDGSTNSYLNSKTVYLFVTADDEDTTKVDKVERYVGGVDFATTDVSGVFAKDGSNADYVVFLDGYTSAEKDIVYISDTASQGSEENGILFKGYRDGGNKEDLVPVYSVYDEGGSSYDTATTSTSIPVGLYEYTLTSKDGMKLKALKAADGFYDGKTVNSVNNGMIDVEDVTDPCDASNVKIVDLTDASDAAENAYGRKVSTLSALKTVVDKKTGDDPTYTVTVDIYVNDDDEVLGLFITNIAEGQGGGATGVTITTANGNIAAVTGTSGAYTVEVPNAPVTAGDSFNVKVKCTSVDGANTNGEIVTVTYNSISKKVLFTAANTTGVDVSFTCAAGQTAVTASVAKANKVTLSNQNATINAATGTNGAYTVELTPVDPVETTEFTVTVKCTSVDGNNTNGETVTVTYNGEEKAVKFTTADATGQTVKFTAVSGQTNVTASVAATPAP
ncbi:hypothetical protein AALA54_11370, partial [Oscillospiraceae bacterium 44-34]